jgi:transcriptional antiterminator RfaH
VGVSDLVRSGDEPLPVAPQIVDALRSQEGAGAFDALARRRLPAIGELVRISAGAFEDMIGRLIELRDQDRVVVLLDLLGRKVRAQIEAVSVEAA